MGRQRKGWEAHTDGLQLTSGHAGQTNGQGEAALGGWGCKRDAPGGFAPLERDGRRCYDGTGAWWGTWGVARVSLATVLLRSVSGRVGEQRVRKEREMELTVPWAGAGVKDEAVAMEEA